jgi:hypothetical protein
MREAKKVYLRTLQGKKGPLDLEYTSTPNTIQDLCIFYSKHGRTKGAATMYWEGLELSHTARREHAADVRFLRRKLISWGQRNRLESCQADGLHT